MRRMQPSFARCTGAILAAWLLALAVPVGAETARGSVFEDLNGNGLREAGEPGIAGVRVSDGLRVVETGQDGGWTLDVEDEAVLFIVKPRGFARVAGGDGDRHSGGGPGRGDRRQR